MKIQNWKEYSEKYCKNIRCVEHNDDNTLNMYTAFNEAEYNHINYIVYKDKVVYENTDFNDVYHRYWGMYEFYKHLKEEKELMEDNQKLHVIVEYNYQEGGYRSFALDGIVFKSEKIAEKYRKIKPDYDSTGVEILTLYPDKE